MDFISTRLPYRETNYFTKTALDYIDRAEELKIFFSQPPTIPGIQSAIAARKNYPTNRRVLVEHLVKQYSDLTVSEKVRNNIELLLSDNSFTITTAHQPNLFLGPLYFLFKILHVIRVAEQLNGSLPDQKFVPVFYMGSEDADLVELNHIYIDGQKLCWSTKQTGAFGRMKIDKELLNIISQIEGTVSVLPFGNEIISLLNDCYREGETIQAATFKLINALFGEYGLIVLIADSTILKKQMVKIFEDDLMNQTASEIVQSTATKLESAGYKTQAHPRDVNLFYLRDNIRSRIIYQNSRFSIADSRIEFSKGEVLKELEEFPDRFSPNVILRGLYQESILPNIVFVGGGGELAYWLELKDLFDHYKVPYPTLLLRNSFLVVEKKWQLKIAKLGLTIEDFFLTESEIIKKLISNQTSHELKLNGNLIEAEHFYELVKKQAVDVDVTLGRHVDALKNQTLRRLQDLEKKMLKAEKRKFIDQQRQIHTIKQALFPLNGLQERTENFIRYYAKWGKGFNEKLYWHSLTMEQEFVIAKEK